MGQMFSSIIGTCNCSSDKNQKEEHLQMKIENIINKINDNKEAHRANLDRIVRLEDRIDNKMTQLSEKMNRIDDKLDCKLDLIITAMNRPVR